MLTVSLCKKSDGSIFRANPPCIMHPDRIAWVAGFLFVASIFFYTAQRQRLAGVYCRHRMDSIANWESFCKEQGYNIRVDLFVIVPGLYSLTAWRLLSAFYRRNTKST